MSTQPDNIEIVEKALTDLEDISEALKRMQRNSRKLYSSDEVLAKLKQKNALN